MTDKVNKKYHVHIVVTYEPKLGIVEMTDDL
jgi:hypothetical protein